MQQDIDRVLIDRDTIARRLNEMAGRIIADLKLGSEVGGGVPGEGDRTAEAALPKQLPGTEGLTLVPVLTGSIVFVSDLIRRLPLRMRIHLMSVSSYPDRAMTSQGARINAALTHLPKSLEGHNVLLMDDILDSGRTLELVHRELGKRRPSSLRTAVLLRKQRPVAMKVPVDYVAFDVPDEFVVGYGLDHDGYYRNLPDIVTLRPQAVAPSEASAAPATAPARLPGASSA